MPLIAHNKLPTFERLRREGIRVLNPDTNTTREIRQLHIGFLNMMPDAALAATERQFFRLIGESNPIARFYVHPFTLDELPRSEETRRHIDQYYEPFDSIKEQGLDGLIVTGANVEGPDLENQTFWKPLIGVFEWARENVTSTLCSCLATHAVLEFRYGQKRRPRADKKWGVFHHRVLDRTHPLTNSVDTRFDVPHSRWNEVTLDQFRQAGLRVLAATTDGDVHLATSEDGFRTVFFQGHPEYDTISLLKEYKREIGARVRGSSAAYPPFPEHYLGSFEKAVLREYRHRLLQAMEEGVILPAFPEELVNGRLDNTWHDSACAVVGKWMGLIYQLTNRDRLLPFMEGIDPENPLELAP